VWYKLHCQPKHEYHSHANGKEDAANNFLHDWYPTFGGCHDCAPLHLNNDWFHEILLSEMLIEM
jgi:hypothetical protein